VTDTNRTGIDLSTRAWGELVLLSVIWGASFFSIAIALREIGPVTVVLHRVGWAAGAYLLYYRVLAMAGAGNLLLCTLIIPPIAILLGVGFLGESLAPQTLAGFALIAAGLALIDGRLLRVRLTNA